MTIHHLKTWPPFYQAAKRGRKPFEIRPNDRDYREGDTIVLQEWIPDPGAPDGGAFTGDWCAFKCGFVFQGGGHEFGRVALLADHCAFALLPHPTLTPAAVPPMAADALGPTVRAV